MLLADLAHVALALDRRHGHDRLDAELAQGIGAFFHFSGAALAVARHALQVVGHHLRPIQAGIVVLHRGGDFVDHAGARRRQKTFQGQRLDALDHDAAHHLDGGGGADLGARNGGAHVERGEQRSDRLRMRTGEQHRRAMPRRMDRRQHRDIDIARRRAEQLCGFLLAPGRNRIDVEKERLSGHMRLDRLRRFDARRRGHGGDDHFRAAHRLGGRAGAGDADGRGGFAQPFALGFRQQNVPGRDRRHAGLAPAGGDGLPGFTETDERNFGKV
ncbi:MAG TPA: hypothetical protein VFA80_11975 [Xanthobacteraceae bacterium]|nr:hypothetical protein [Xanthobacteraceae bacterium]